MVGTGGVNVTRGLEAGSKVAEWLAPLLADDAACAHGAHHEAPLDGTGKARRSLRETAALAARSGLQLPPALVPATVRLRAFADAAEAIADAREVAALPGEPSDDVLYELACEMERRFPALWAEVQGQ